MNLLSSAQLTPSSQRTRARETETYRLRLASCQADVRAAQALRFAVFNVELDEGLVHSYDTGLDADPFDTVCDHLLVEEASSNAVVGTYRLQTGARAASALGYYGEREFDFAPFEPLRRETLELGRACIDQGHRSFSVLNLLWKGIALYAQRHRARYLIGCSSLTSQDAALGAAAFRHLQAHLAPPERRTRPWPEFACPLDSVAGTPPHIPRLLSAYLALGAEICGAPAIDREFRTVDFLTCLDLGSPGMAVLQRRWRIAV
jgi:putative hemolysin